MRFELHHPSMDLVFNFHKRRFRVRFAPFFHIGQNLFALPESGFMVHCFSYLFPSFGAMILPAFLFPVHLLAKS